MSIGRYCECWQVFMENSKVNLFILNLVALKNLKRIVELTKTRHLLPIIIKLFKISFKCKKSKILAFIIRTSSSYILGICLYKHLIQVPSDKKNSFFDTFFKRFHTFSLVLLIEKRKSHKIFGDFLKQTRPRFACFFYL